MRTCPNCGEEVYEINSKLICTSNNCMFQCKMDEYEFCGKSWGEKLALENKLWDKDIFDKYPYFIASEYKRLQQLLKDGKLYGVIFQIKDLFELILKLPTILVINDYLNNKKRDINEDKIIKMLLENKLSLGHWNEIASKCSISNERPIGRIINNVLNLYDKNKIIMWRNDTLGHGVLQFDDSEEFKEDIKEKIELLKKHFEYCKEEYLGLKICYKRNGEYNNLVGINVDKKKLNVDSKLYFVENENYKLIENLMLIDKNEIYIFDSYNKDKKKVKLFDYVNGKTLSRKQDYFYKIYIKINAKIDNDGKCYIKNKSTIDDSIYLKSEEELLEFIDKSQKIITPNYIDSWLNKCIKDNLKGIYILKMDRGLGKTTFTKLLDPHSKGKLNKVNIATRAIYINNMYSYKINVFRNNLIDILRFNDEKTDLIKGEIPSFRTLNRSEMKQELAEILNYFRKVYHEKFGKEKLLIILDGIDEIVIDGKESIFDYIPTKDLIDEGIHILLTSRTENNLKYNYEMINLIETDSELVVYSNDEQYKANVKEFLKSHCKIKKEDKINKIMKNAKNKFLYIRPLEHIYRFTGCIPENIDGNEIFKSFIELLQQLYSEKFFHEIIQILGILACSRRPMTIKEVSYMLNFEDPDFKILSYFADLNCLLLKERSYRGNLISIAHSEFREYLLTAYYDVIKEISKIWIEEVLLIKNINFETIDEGKLYLICNSIYFSKEYNVNYIDKIIKQLDINNSFNLLDENLKEYKITLLLTFINDFIEGIERNKRLSKKLAKKLLKLYFTKLFICINVGTNLDANYIRDFEKVIEIIKNNNLGNENLIQLYSMRSNYFRKIGNVKKSMDDINHLSLLMQGMNKNLNNIDINKAALANIFLQKGINLKNLGDIDKALEISFKALDVIANRIGIEDKIVKSNILNNIALCYKNNNELEQAEKYISESIMLAEEVESNKVVYNSIIYTKYANKGQIFRKKGDLKGSLEIYNKTLNLIKNEQENGEIIEVSDIALIYNGRANINYDLGKLENNEEKYKLALMDYLEALKILENVESEKRDIRFLEMLYSNISNLYKEKLEDETNAKIYLQKYNEVNNKCFSNQTDIDVNDIDFVKKKTLNEIINLQRQGIRNFEKKRYEDSILYFDEALKKIGSLGEDNEYEELISVLYDNKANSQFKLLENRVILNFNLKSKWNIVEDYSKFSPLEIVDNFLKSLNEKFISIEEKSIKLVNISFVYLEALKDYNNAKAYAIKAIETGVNLENSYLCLANVLFEERKFEVAIKYYNSVLKINPNNKSAKDNLKLALKIGY